jgi:hypothetical protein
MQSLSKQDILNALQELATELQREGLQARVHILGGAAMVLLFNARQSTRDIDVVIPDEEQRRVVWIAGNKIAGRLNLPIDWINDAAKGYLNGLSEGQPVFESKGLKVIALGHDQLLAMKLSAWRDDIDIADARLLLRQMKGSCSEVWNLVGRYIVPGRELKARYAFDDLWEAQHGCA